MTPHNDRSRLIRRGLGAAFVVLLLLAVALAVGCPAPTA